jgi:lipopolysaccharide/colanic/teichoic acid biosynthesis glycosyltransferase
VVAVGRRGPERTDGGRRGRHGRRAAEAAHRAVDVAVAGALLLVTAPLLVPAALAVRATLGTPVLFRQPRVGRAGEPFDLVKLRTMRAAGAGEDGPDTDRKRLTRLGRFLRATSIDELPSLLAVLRGEMSIVGPRPLPVRYLPRYSARQARRHDVRPGLTGWAQVNGRNRLGWDDRLELDVWYVEHRSLRLDLRIIARTVPVVLGRAGVSADGHATMPELAGPAGGG